MNKVSVNKTGLVFGVLFAIIHAGWALMVLFNVAKPTMDWIFNLHFLNFQYEMNPFSWGQAVMLVIVTAIIGYVGGVILAWLWNYIHQK